MTDRAGDGSPGIVRRRLVCRGAVQGVGFRPAAHRLACSLRLSGWVRNGPEGAVIEIEGPADAVDSFVERFPGTLPPIARLDALKVEEIAAAGSAVFSVEESVLGARRGALVPPDAAICPDCRREMEDPADRRHRYPFTTCTNCGPRFSLASALPYDRERTSMACFPLCDACGREYRDPSDRRFHAEPVCCPECGPHLRLLDAAGAALGEGSEALRAAREALARGAILAVKGLGGFQLACRADREDVVVALRARKGRPTKPLALMAKDLGAARALVELGPEDARLLESPRAPILLAPRREPSRVAPAVAPGIGDLGVMLPTTPLHVEIFRDAPFDVLVMTSGNRSDEPICRRNREALARLAGIADLFLVHDRDVVRRADDSVLRTSPAGAVMVRRSRGFVPEPLPLPERAPHPVLALGGHLQSTSCLAVEDAAFPSQHVGDLDTETARAFLVEASEGLEEFLQARPRVVATDLHPDYPSTWIGTEVAARRGAAVLRVQHHLAHAAAVLAEHERFPRSGEMAGAIVLDGTGWGPDGVAWGGEWLLLGGNLGWSRAASLTPVRLVGGEAAVREPWRVAVAALVAERAGDLIERLPIAGIVDSARLREVGRLAASPRWPLATGAGRIFEAAGALLGLAAANGWEGEAAARFESLAATHRGEPPDWSEVALGEEGGRARVPGPLLIAAAARRAAAGEDPARLAAGFHATFSRLASEATLRAFPRGTAVVGLGGGCFVNRLLREGIVARLRAQGIETLVPVALPPGDGSIAYGQSVLATVGLARGVEPRRVEEA